MNYFNYAGNVIESMLDTLIVVNPEAKISLVNSATEKLLGYDKSELIGKPIGAVIPENNLDFFSALRDMIQTDSICNYNLSYLNRKQEKIPICFNGSVMRDDKGTLLGMVGIGRDMRESQRLIEELETAKEALEEKVAERTSALQSAKEEIEQAYNILKKTKEQLVQTEKMSSIGQLAAGIAHEINNPIGFINSNLGTLEEYSTDIVSLINKIKEGVEQAGDNRDRAAPFMKEISELCTSMDIEFVMEDLCKLIAESKEGAERVKKIVQDLKDFARLDTTELKPANINDELDKTLNIIWNELKYKTDVIKKYGDIPLITCNARQLDQVFMNIIINAAQAIETHGEIKLETFFENEHVVVEITDTGPGIPEENIPKLFDPFFTTKEVGKGTGLGLNISYNIIQNHGGKIEVNSALGKGTRFRITLPESNPAAKEEA